MIFTIKLAFPALNQQFNPSFSKMPPTPTVSQKKLIIHRFGFIFKF